MREMAAESGKDLVCLGEPTRAAFEVLDECGDEGELSVAHVFGTRELGDVVCCRLEVAAETGQAVECSHAQGAGQVSARVVYGKQVGWRIDDGGVDDGGVGCLVGGRGDLVAVDAVDARFEVVSERRGQSECFGTAMAGDDTPLGTRVAVELADGVKVCSTVRAPVVNGRCFQVLVEGGFGWIAEIAGCTGMVMLVSHGHDAANVVNVIHVLCGPCA
jgi:hypothetical protein